MALEEYNIWPLVQFDAWFDPETMWPELQRALPSHKVYANGVIEQGPTGQTMGEFLDQVIKVLAYVDIDPVKIEVFSVASSVDQERTFIQIKLINS